MSNFDIAIAANWEDEPDVFVNTLVNIKFLDSSENSLQIHNWAEHNPYIATQQKRQENARKINIRRWDKTAGVQNSSEIINEINNDINNEIINDINNDKSGAVINNDVNNDINNEINNEVNNELNNDVNKVCGRFNNDINNDINKICVRFNNELNNDINNEVNNDINNELINDKSGTVIINDIINDINNDIINDNNNELINDINKNFYRVTERLPSSLLSSSFPSSTLLSSSLLSSSLLPSSHTKKNINTIVNNIQKNIKMDKGMDKETDKETDIFFELKEEIRRLFNFELEEKDTDKGMTILKLIDLGKIKPENIKNFRNYLQGFQIREEKNDVVPQFCEKCEELGGYILAKNNDKEVFIFCNCEYGEWRRKKDKMREQVVKTY
jgi:hypothetical protein